MRTIQTKRASANGRLRSPLMPAVRRRSKYQKRKEVSLGSVRQEVEKLEHENDEPVDRYHVWVDADGECELLPGDKSHVISTLPVKTVTTNAISILSRSCRPSSKFWLLRPLPRLL